ncbi:hypothetical protein [Neisseria iguanae]|uniref:Uncharacterized protein n=1 Tax=Neisseria iguanae TaxID=90242 RepID=A0A2P7U1L0_9NEIS|nr:hypothetical protein [Neisseria iguanae]PSJ80868.1 hypothetical protein C7N83_03555 [Neisseria iguanae]
MLFSSFYQPLSDNAAEWRLHKWTNNLDKNSNLKTYAIQYYAIQYLDKLDNDFRQYGIDPVGGYYSKYREINSLAEGFPCLEEKGRHHTARPICLVMRLKFDDPLCVKWREERGYQNTFCPKTPYNK